MSTARMTCSQDEGNEKHPKHEPLMGQGLGERKGEMSLEGGSSKATEWRRKNEETRQGLNLGEGDKTGLNGAIGKREQKPRLEG